VGRTWTLGGAAGLAARARHAA